MLYALRRMQAERGIERAYVGHEPPAKNPASGALYASVGFKPLYDIYDFKKPLQQSAGAFELALPPRANLLSAAELLDNTADSAILDEER